MAEPVKQRLERMRAELDDIEAEIDGREVEPRPLSIREATAMLVDISNRMARFEDVDQAEIDAFHDAIAVLIISGQKAAGRG